MNQLAIAETCNHVWFMMDVGLLSFWRRSKNFSLHLVHQILDITYTLDVNLHVFRHPEEASNHNHSHCLFLSVLVLSLVLLCPIIKDPVLY